MTITARDAVRYAVKGLPVIVGGLFLVWPGQIAAAWPAGDRPAGAWRLVWPAVAYWSALVLLFLLLFVKVRGEERDITRSGAPSAPESAAHSNRRISDLMWNVGHVGLAALLWAQGSAHVFWGWQIGASAMWTIAIVDLYLLAMLFSVACDKWDWLPDKPVALITLPILLWVLVLTFGTRYVEDGNVRRVKNAQGETEALARGWDATYFSLVTLTTLGYGDYTPYATSARKIVVLELSSGVLLLLVAIPVLASRLAAVESAPAEVAVFRVQRSGNDHWRLDTGNGWQDLAGGDELGLVVRGDGSVSAKT